MNIGFRATGNFRREVLVSKLVLRTDRAISCRVQFVSCEWAHITPNANDQWRTERAVLRM